MYSADNPSSTIENEKKSFEESVSVNRKSFNDNEQIGLNVEKSNSRFMLLSSTLHSLGIIFGDM